MQEPPQSTRPPTHAQVPPAQTWPLLHAWPHEPQFDGSIWKLVQ